jgi:hypothetical protein
MLLFQIVGECFNDKFGEMKASGCCRFVRRSSVGKAGSPVPFHKAARRGSSASRDAMSGVMLEMMT